KTGNPRTWRAEQSSYDGNPLEGYLFPDTYRLYKDASADDVIRKMLGNFDRKLTKDMRNEIILQRKTIYEIVTIASLIEKEVKSPEDKVLVSGILWKRLQLKIALQVDASIIYIKTNGRSQLNGGEKVLYEDLKIDSPYNTYKYRGLPPGPISNPGLESIEAAIYPKQSPYLFYISTPDGKTIYSKTLEEHNTAVAKYLR
ncbi:MAG: endolytic transglycosylase MltG, partial [Patescibacteria group bacterium]